MDLRIKNKKDHDFIVKTVRKNKDFFKELNITNSKFDKPTFKDELDWLCFLLDSSFTLVWEDGKERGIIGTLHAFNERDVINNGEEVNQIKAYWYTLPSSDKVELVYKNFLENYFKCQIEGVKINGSLNAKPKNVARKTSRKPTIVESNGKPSLIAVH